MRSRRLRAVAAYCIGPVVADIGFDHGQLLAFLHRQYSDWRLIGVEIRDHLVAQAGLPDAIELRHADGVQGVQPGEVDCLVLAGLGEERIRQLLQRDWLVATSCQRLICCASSIDGRLRPWLNARSWRAVTEQIVRDAGRLYVVSAFEPGVETCQDPERCRWGPRLEGDPLLQDYLEFWHRRFTGGVHS
jgi:tRNA (adenine22-N1)-methyltransferase